MKTVSVNISTVHASLKGSSPSYHAVELQVSLQVQTLLQPKLVGLTDAPPVSSADKLDEANICFEQREQAQGQWKKSLSVGGSLSVQVCKTELKA